MKQQPRLAAALVASALLSVPTVTQADAPLRAADLADQARAVLRQHCLRCHGDRPRNGLRLLEQPLHGPGRSLIAPGAPERSLLLDLVEGGSMPPGALPKVPARDRAVLREWIRAGAAAFPPETGRDYLLRLLADDFRKLPEPTKPYVRYLSLDHLGPDPANRQAAASVLRAVLRHLSADGKPPLDPVAVEPAGRLLRIDLRQGGWDRKLFMGETLNLFDLLLMEYPYGVLPGGKLPADLTTFLRQTRPVRPILYLRGDWLARIALREPLNSDLLEALGKPEGSLPPRNAREPLPGAIVSFSDAVRELERNPDTSRLQGVLRAIPALAPLTRNETVKRTLWERHYLEVVGRLGGDLPIVPLDGMTWPSHDADPEFKVRFHLIDAKGPGLPANRPARDRFIVNKDEMSTWIHANQDVFIELTFTDRQESKKLITREPYLLTPKNPLVTPGRVVTSPGKRYFTLFAYPKSGLAATPYPAGKLLTAEGISDRFLHPFYELAEDGNGIKGPDPAKMVKITVPFAVVP